MFKQLVTVMAVGAACLILTGCNAKETGKVLIEKTYKVVVNIENVIVKSSTSEFINTAKTLDVPLKLVGMALTYVEPKITDPKVKEAIASAVKGINKVSELIATLTPEKVDETKAQMIGSLENIKTALKFIGQYFGCQFPPDVAMISARANTTAAQDLANAVKELEVVLKKCK